MAHLEGGDKLNNDPTKAFKSTALQRSRFWKDINKKLWSTYMQPFMHLACLLLSAPFPQNKLQLIMRKVPP